jgi:hypothetical protein
LLAKDRLFATIRAAGFSRAFKGVVRCFTKNQKTKEHTPMADLTDADKKSFIDKVIGALKENKDLLISKDWDPSQRILNLGNGVTSVTNDEGILSKLEQAVTVATTTRRTDLDNNYALASASIGAVESSLGKDHPFVNDLHQIRGGMSRASSPKKAGTPA